MTLAKYIPFILIISILFGCKKDQDGFNNQIFIAADLLTEETTHTFAFKVATKNPLNPKEKIYCRYDWDGDYVWDTPYTEDLDIHHRYYIPGEYTLRVEFLTKSGFTSSDSLNIKVVQGYSKPKCDFLTLPNSGNFKTEFLFDASITTDDEDSLHELKFKWDIFNDGLYETSFQESPSKKFTFKSTGKYPVKLEVKDPSNLFSSVIHWVEIHNTDTLIRPVVNITPWEGSVIDTFLFDASETFHETDPSRLFEYTWLFPNERSTATSPDSAIVSRFFERPGPVSVSLIITDQYGLENVLKTELYVALGNRPPTAFFEIPNSNGNIATQFYFSAWGSKDDNAGGTQIQKRWDFDGDGIYDTPWSKEMEQYHQYSKSGSYKPTLEVMDDEGLTDQFSLDVQVSPYTNPTGFIIDARDKKMYSTVKIGNYWWMAENLDWRPDLRKAELNMIHRCYDENKRNCDKYGGLYLMPYVKYYMDAGKNVCPDGWHVPDKVEIEDLRDQLPDNNSRVELEPGGSLDFNAMYSGRADYYFEYHPTIPDKVVDTVWHFKELGSVGYVASIAFKHQYRVLNLQFTKEGLEAWVFWYPGERYYYPIRCVKD